jgi:hypothetical protein
MNTHTLRSLDTSMTLGHLDLSTVKKVVIVRPNGGTRTMQVAADIAKFVREHHSDAIERYENGRYVSAGPTANYKLLRVILKEAVPA